MNRLARILLPLLTILFLASTQFFVAIPTTTTILASSKRDQDILLNVRHDLHHHQPTSQTDSKASKSSKEQNSKDIHYENECPGQGMLSVSDRGRLGNLMSQYATLYAFSKMLNRSAVISRHMKDTLQRVFPQLSIPVSSCPR